MRSGSRSAFNHKPTSRPRLGASIHLQTQQPIAVDGGRRGGDPAEGRCVGGRGGNVCIDYRDVGEREWERRVSEMFNSLPVAAPVLIELGCLKEIKRQTRRAKRCSPRQTPPQHPPPSLAPGSWSHSL